MMASASGLASCQSPCDLMRLAQVEPMSPYHKCILDALYGASPTVEQSRLWKDLSAMPWPNRAARRAALAAGRRFGKTSEICGWVLPYEVLCVPHELHAAEGSRVYYLLIAPFLQQTRESFRAVRTAFDACARVGVRYELRDLGGQPELVVTSPASRVEKVVKVMSADAVSVRGFAVAFVALDECAFLPSSEWHAQTDRDLVRAITPGQAQFREARQLWVSSPGAPQGEFHRLVTKPPKDTLVIRAPTWFNPRISEAQCRDLAGDDATFEQEYAARKFGFNNETFIDASRIVLGSPFAGLGPRPGSFVIGLDVAQLRDATAIVVCSSFEVEVSPTTAPIRSLVVERSETIESDRKAPTPIEAIAARVVGLSRSFGNAPVIFDPFQGPTVKAALEKLGMREFVDTTGAAVPRPGTFCQRSMAPQHQTPRWKLVADLAHGGRLHLGADDEPLARQLGQLHATQLSTGALKVEGRRDDLADALALAAEVAVKLPPVGGPQGSVEFRDDGAYYDAAGVHLRNPRFVRVMPNGSEQLAECPQWHPHFESYAREMAASGTWTPAVRAWFDRQSPHVQREIRPTLAETTITVPIRHF